MASPLRVRRQSVLAPLAPYFPLVVWPIIWGLPYGWWTWVIAFSPALLLRSQNHFRFRRATTRVDVRRTGSGVELVDVGTHDVARPVASFTDGQVETVTQIVDATMTTRELRLGFTSASSQRPLVFTTDAETPPADVAQRLGLDLEQARSQYRAGSLALRFLIVRYLGIASLVWVVAAPPEPVVVFWIWAFIRFVWLPFTILYMVPTWVDVGRDGIAWRWLFMRRFVPFSAIHRVEGVSKDKRTIRALHIELKNDKYLRIPLVLESTGLLQHVARLMTTHAKAPEPAAIDTWLPRAKDEPLLAWVQRIRSVSRSDGVYRGAPVDHLWRIAEDATARTELRAGALLALCNGPNAGDRARALANHAADPVTREIFEAVAAGATDETLASLLARPAADRSSSATGGD